MYHLKKVRVEDAVERERTFYACHIGVCVSTLGRTHQIRVHGLSIGHPLVGDDKYGHETEYRGPKPRRLCLHAMRLEIPGYPTIEAPLPEDMQSLVAQLRAQKPTKW